MAGAEPLQVEVAWCGQCVTLTVPLGTTVRGVLERARVAERMPGFDITTQVVGLQGRQVTLEALVTDGDRVEIYRPLKVDPKERRRRRSQR